MSNMKVVGGGSAGSKEVEANFKDVLLDPRANEGLSKRGAVKSDSGNSRLGKREHGMYGKTSEYVKAPNLQSDGKPRTDA